LQKSIPTKGSGFTIVECLLAIILVGILMTAIAPVIVLSVATRVQARRVEQATASARSYIDGLQTGAIKPPPASTFPLNEVDASNPNIKKFASARDLFATSIPAPPTTPITTCGGDISTNPAFPYCVNDATSNLSLYCVDNGGGCASGNSKDFIVQAYRSAKSTTTGVPDLDPNTGLPTDDGSKGYLLGVRVYRADAFDGSSDPLKTTAVNGGKRAATTAGGRGDQRSPIVEMTTEIRTTGTDYQSLCDRLGGCNSPSN
jgi:prepilin-type N-terminal cleavage/methylation domain-containing protein